MLDSAGRLCERLVESAEARCSFGMLACELCRVRAFIAKGRARQDPTGEDHSYLGQDEGAEST